MKTMNGRKAAKLLVLVSQNRWWLGTVGNSYPFSLDKVGIQRMEGGSGKWARKGKYFLELV